MIMKNYYIYILSFILFCACQSKDSLMISDAGYLQLNVMTNSSVSTKAEYDARQIAVKILDAKGVVVKQTDDWETWSNKTFELPTGIYTIQASSNGFDGKTPAFDKPYYAGSQKIVIEKSQTVQASIICILANVKVSVSFSDAYRKEFKAGTVQIGAAEEGASYLSFLMSDNNLASKFAYFPAGPLAWSIAVVNKNGVTKILKDTIEAVAARDYFKFNFTIASSSNITITVDETTKDYNYVVGIPTVLPEFKITTGSSINSWSRFAELNGDIFSQMDINTGQIYFKYKKETEEVWNIAQTTVTSVSTSKYAAFSKIANLAPNTKYSYFLMYEEGDVSAFGDTLSFTTEEEIALYNGNFDTWYMVDKTWYTGVSSEGRNSFWDSGNCGTTTGLGAMVNVNPTYPTSEIVHTSAGKAAVLKSQYASAVGIGKFAAGNIYTGNFVSLVSTKGAKLNFGQPFTSRPTKLHGWFQYNSGKVDYATHGLSKGDTDVNAIYIALTDKGSSYLIDNTKAETFIDYENDANIIAYGELPAADCVSTDGKWKEFTIDLKYRSLTRKPTHIIIVASASKYGDYFTGSTSSVMYIDDFELLYDGDPVVETK